MVLYVAVVSLPLGNLPHHTCCAATCHISLGGYLHTETRASPAYPPLPCCVLSSVGSLHNPDVLDARLTACTQCSGSLSKVLPGLGLGYSKFMR